MAPSSTDPRREYVVLLIYPDVPAPMPYYTLADSASQAAVKVEQSIKTRMHDGIAVHPVPWSRPGFWKLMERGREPMPIAHFPLAAYDFDWFVGAHGATSGQR